jgi:hypothetical protein
MSYYGGYGGPISRGGSSGYGDFSRYGDSDGVWKRLLHLEGDPMVTVDMEAPLSTPAMKILSTDTTAMSRTYSYSNSLENLSHQ